MRGRASFALTAFLLLFLGFGVKAGMIPLHIWLPNAYALSPHAATAFIAACSTKVALYVLLRFDFFIFQGNVPGHEALFTGFVLPLAVITILVASVLALYQRNLKRLLAYSSIAQMGIILTGAALSSAAGLTAGDEEGVVVARAPEGRGCWSGERRALERTTCRSVDDGVELPP